MDEPWPRFLLYSHDSVGLGHVRRSLSIAWGLSVAFPSASLLCVTGSPLAPSFTYPPRTDCLQLPAARKNESGEYVARNDAIPFTQLLALRSTMIDACIRSYRPHLVLVDHTPLGLAGELIGALRRARVEDPGIRIVMGLRDIYDDSAAVRRTWPRGGVLRALESIYDRILVYGQRTVFDIEREYALTPETARKVVYTGYVHWRTEVAEPTDVIRSRLGVDDSPLVLVTVGGGDDGHEIIQQYLDGLGAMGSRCPWRSLIVTGPLMRGSHQETIKATARLTPGVSVVKFTPNFQDYVAAADVVVTMGGYNTVTEVLARGGKRVIVVPRISPRKEQLVRAQRLSQRGLLQLLHPSRCTSAELVAAVRQAFSKPLSAGSGNLDFGGVHGTVSAIANLLGVARSYQRLALNSLSSLFRS